MPAIPTQSREKPRELPKQLKPYPFHGVDLDWQPGVENIITACPWCGREGKFSVNSETGQWRCYVCGGGDEGKGGNVYVFLRRLFSSSDQATRNYSNLASNRKLLYEETLMAWQAAVSLTTKDWMLPGYSVDGKLNQLYRYAMSQGKRRLLATPGLNHCLFSSAFNPSAETVYVCEGPWDGMVLWETLGFTREEEGEWKVTANRERSFLADSTVLAVPGCNVFSESWLPLFEGKRVVLLFDNDHPRLNPRTQEPIPSAGFEGMKRVAGLLARAKPKEVCYLKWGEVDHDPSLPSGFDVRDFLTTPQAEEAPFDSGEADEPNATLNEPRHRIARLRSLLSKVVVVPPEWLGNDVSTKKGSTSGGSSTMELTTCQDYRQLMLAWRKAMRWTDGLDHALTAMLACIASTRSVGDQLWIKVIGPAACLHGSTFIWDPVARTVQTVQNRWKEGKPFWVLTRKQDGSIGSTRALPPAQFPKEMMYEVRFKAGHRMQVTLGHKFWNGSEYVSLSKIRKSLETDSEYSLPSLENRVEIIVSVQETEPDHYYDFHVPETNNYWAGGVFNHNCGKSTLCEAVSTNTRYILAKSTIRGFHSGYRVEGEGGEQDNSLLSVLDGKTLVTKDGDTLLQSPNLPQILSEGRDVYDGTSRTHYRNAMSKDYEAMRITWILCGTSSLRAIDSSELGERFLDVVIMEGIDDDLEDEVLWRVANRADRNLAIDSGQGSQQYEPDLANAMSLTGGYVDYLRENAQDLYSTIDCPEKSLRKITRFAKFTAHMRARPSLKQDENCEREFASRLTSQLTRLAKSLALVLGKKTVDEDVMERVKRVSLDTSRGKTLLLAHYLYDAHDEGLEPQTMALQTNSTVEKVKVLLRFLKAIEVVEPFHAQSVKGLAAKVKWRLTGRMRRLYREVMGIE